MIHKNMKKINIGSVHIASFDVRCGKMFSYDWYYDKNHEFYENICDKEVNECKPKEIVLPPEQEYTLVIDYPTSYPYRTKLKTGKKGMTRIQLANKICQHYRKMYAEEDDTSGGKTGYIPGTFNRDHSGGKYGIWGHNIEDLILCDATVENNGEIHVGVDS
jgi:hypothetical protein